jgi:MFS family permease
MPIQLQLGDRISVGSAESGYDSEERSRELKYGIKYKWIALSNTTLGGLMAAINGSILIISLPAVFKGLGINPLVPGNIGLLLWILLGYMIVSSVTVVTIGRLSDMFGRVRLYNLGFLIFTVFSILLYASSYLVTGVYGALSIIILRLFQGFGGAFLFANGAAILTDAFPPNERGRAMGFNQIAAVGGSLAGLLIGGVLATIDWHLIFLISVPFGVIGTVWAYVALHEIATIKKGQRLDIYGNVAFAASLTIILLSITYALFPYGAHPMGWYNPAVILGMAAGTALMAGFILIESRVAEPMFNLGLFRIRQFSAGNASLLLAGVARGGLQFMLIIWLQGIYLPLHGVSFENTPLQAAIYMVPLIVGFLVSGPLSGYLSDRYGARLFSTTGMLVGAAGFVALSFLPANFNPMYFGILIFILGIGQGMFAAPNTTAIMNSLPPEKRGAGSGMRATFTNISFMFSLAIFFTLLVTGTTQTMPSALYNGLVSQNVSSSVALSISKLPTTSALFAALLGYNPLATILPSNVLAALPAQNSNTILGTSFFPNLISKPFMSGLRVVFLTGAALSVIAAIASALRGPRYVWSHTAAPASRGKDPK